MTAGTCVEQNDCEPTLCSDMTAYADECVCRLLAMYSNVGPRMLYISKFRDIGDLIVLMHTAQVYKKPIANVTPLSIPARPEAE